MSDQDLATYRKSLLELRELVPADAPKAEPPSTLPTRTPVHAVAHAVTEGIRGSLREAEGVGNYRVARD